MPPNKNQNWKQNIGSKLVLDSFVEKHTQKSITFGEGARRLLQPVAELLMRTDLESLQVESKHRHAQTIDSRDIEALDLLTVKRFNKAARTDFLNTDERPNRAAVTSPQIVATADSVRTLSEAHVKRIFGGTRIRPCVLGFLQWRWTNVICDLGRWCYDSAKVAKRSTARV